MGCLVQIVLKNSAECDEEEFFCIMSKFHELFGPKPDIVSKVAVGDKLQVDVYVPWNENETSRKLHKIKRDKIIHKAKLIC